MEDAIFGCHCCGGEYDEKQMNDHDEHDVCDLCHDHLEDNELE